MSSACAGRMIATTSSKQEETTFFNGSFPSLDSTAARSRPSLNAYEYLERIHRCRSHSGGDGAPPRPSRAHRSPRQATPPAVSLTRLPSPSYHQKHVYRSEERRVGKEGIAAWVEIQ